MRSNYWDKETEDEVAEQEEAAEKCECYDLTTAQARIAELEGERKQLDEEGFIMQVVESSDAINHCNLKWAEELKRADTLQAQVERLTEALKESMYFVRCLQCIDNLGPTFRDKVDAFIDKAALTPGRKGG